jgi:hypothetical protein
VRIELNVSFSERGWVRSVGNEAAMPPDRVISASRIASLLAVRARSATAKPLDANARATAAPVPVELGLELSEEVERELLTRASPCDDG